MRLFAAIELDEGMRRAVASVQDELRHRGARGRFSPVENLHLTLAFIGEYPDAAEALACVESVPLTPFELRLRGLGAFGDLWWLGLADSPPLEACARRLRRALAEAGIPFDRKRFSAHITLARQMDCDRRALAGLEVPDAAMTVREISLMRSDRGRNGMIYTRIQ